MSFLALPFPNIDPVALQLGPLSVKWYGLAYMAGLLLGWFYVRRLVTSSELWPANKAPFAESRVDDLLVFMTLGVVVGGRLGFILFYEPLHFFSHPMEIFAVWKGGMAFHGALVGCGLAIWAFAYRQGVNVWSVMDLSAAAVPIGLFFGRIANFINGELYGRPTDMPWGMVFPEAARFVEYYGQAEPTPRHPSQLYESFLEGLVLFLVLRFLTHNMFALKRPGMTVGAFLAGYGVARSFCELFRQYDPHHALSAYGLTPGIAYSIPMVVLGVWFIYLARSRAPATA